MTTTIVVSGPRASGKTTLALSLGAALGIPVFSRDPLMAVLLRSGLPKRRLGPLRAVPAVGLDLVTTLLARQLELRQSAVIECVAPPGERDRWRRMTREAGGRYVSVECICSDRTEHRARFERRQATADRRGYGWRYVAATIGRYRPDGAPDFVADAVRPPADLLAELVALIGR
jgi:hypothetical protein